MIPRTKHIFITHWETVAVTALPVGWRNTYAVDGLTETEPCPAMLLQEDRGTTEVWDEPDGDRFRHRDRYTPADEPYETRVVFASYSSDEAYLEPADDACNYGGTFGPGCDAPVTERIAS